MRRTVLAVAMFALVAVAIGGTIASAHDWRDQHTIIRTLEVNKHSDFVDVGTKGLSLGDLDVVHTDLVDRATHEPIGFAQVSCTTAVVEPFSLECYGTMHLPDGIVNVAGSWYPDITNKWGVTGGTEKYQRARGYMTLAPAPSGTLYDTLYLVMP